MSIHYGGRGPGHIARVPNRYPAGAIYVSKSADNGFGTGDDSRTASQAENPATPWATISKAVASAPSGRTVVINDGTYSALELGSLSYVLFTSSKTLSFMPRSGGTVVFLGTVATAVMRFNSAAASASFVFYDITFDGDNTANYAILDNAGSTAHTLTFNNCTFSNTTLHGITGSTTAATINLIDCTFNSVTRGYISMTALGATSRVNIFGGSATITGTNNASPCINIKATTAGAAVSVGGGFTMNVTLDNSLTGTGAHDGLVLTNISTVGVNDSTFNLLGHPGSRSGGCVMVAADAAVTVTATITGNTVYNETTGGYGIVAGSDGSSAGNAYVVDPVVNDNVVTAIPAYQATPTHGILIGHNIGGTILRNAVVGCGLSLLQKQNTVRGALFAGNTVLSPYSIALYGKGSLDTRFVNNSIYITDTAHASDSVTVFNAQVNDASGTNATGTEFTNNAIHVAGNVLAKYVNVGASSSATFSNNLYYSDFSLPANPFSYDGVSYADIPAWVAAKEATAVSGDPEFVDGAAGDFLLLAGSACIGAGVAVSDVSTDKAGNAFATPRAIGAYEYSA